MWPNKAAAILFVWLGTTAAVAGGVPCSADSVIFQTDRGLAPVQVEIADDEAERARGLMYRRHLPPGAGMLFIYDSPRRVSFWMRNTFIPLDLIFLDQSGVIRHIHRNAVPLDDSSISGAAASDPRPERLMVVEVAAGQADSLGLMVGQPMAHPRLQQDLAHLPCR